MFDFVRHSVVNTKIIQTDATLGGITRTLRYAFDPNNNRTRVTHPDNVWFQYDFDKLNRVNRLSETVIPMLDVAYHTAGRRSAILRNYNAGAGTVATRTDYQFDNAQRLSSFIQDFPNSGLDLTNTFTYNPASQVTQLTQSNTLYQYTGNENRTGAYTINGLNQYTAVNSAVVSYDNNGNLTNDSGAIYQYDDENRLRSTSGTGIAASTLKYDPLGRLYETTIAGVVTRFLYDGDALVAEYNSAGTLTRRYVHGDQVDEPWVQYSSAATGSANWCYLHADHQGSIIAHSSVNGAQLAALSYDAYGIPKSTNSDRFGYTGQAWLKELGLFHYKARMYSPKLGRFLQTDPIFYADQMNMYAYVGNDPVNNLDPTGKVIVPVGSVQQKKAINSALSKIEQSNPKSAARIQQLEKSNNVHSIRFPNAGEGPHNSATGVKGNESNKVGTGSETVVDPTKSVTTTNTDGTKVTSSGETVLTHELLGHGGDKDSGTMDRSTNPATGERKSEESAMDAENEYKDAAGETRRDCHSKC